MLGQIESKTKKQQFAWAFYDWSNSVYSLVISTAIFPIYFGNVIQTKGAIQCFGIVFKNKEILYTKSIAVSFFLVVLISPFLSAISDRIGNKKLFLKIFCYLGSISCAMLFFFTNENTLWIGMLFSILASLGFWGSLVYYNAYLPEIAIEEERDYLSAKGFSLGYWGSAILLILCLAMILGIGTHLTKYSFLLVAIWWMGFAQYTFKNLPNSFSPPSKNNRKSNTYIELITIGKELMNLKNINIFLLSFFCLSLGIQTIIVTATRYGDQELGIDQVGLILTILIIQFVAIFGTWFFSKLSANYGNIKSLQIGLLIWVMICIGAFLLKKENSNVQIQFYFLGGFLGLVLGGIQSLSRSTYSKLIPQNRDSAKYFSFYDIVEKIALILGTSIYAFLIWLTDSMRASALSLSLFFLMSFIFLFWVKIQSKEIK